MLPSTQQDTLHVRCNVKSINLTNYLLSHIKLWVMSLNRARREPMDFLTSDTVFTLAKHLQRLNIDTSVANEASTGNATVRLAETFFTGPTKKTKNALGTSVWFVCLFVFQIKRKKAKKRQK